MGFRILRLDSAAMREDHSVTTRVHVHVTEHGSPSASVGVCAGEKPVILGWGLVCSLSILQPSDLGLHGKPAGQHLLAHAGPDTCGLGHRGSDDGGLWSTVNEGAVNDAVPTFLVVCVSPKRATHTPPQF